MHNSASLFSILTDITYSKNLVLFLYNFLLYNLSTMINNKLILFIVNF